MDEKKNNVSLSLETEVAKRFSSRLQIFMDIESREEMCTWCLTE